MTASNVLLLVGYALAVGSSFKLRRAFRKRRLPAFLVFEAGTAAVVAGLVLRRRWGSAALNAVVLVGLALAWRLRRPPCRRVGAGP